MKGGMDFLNLCAGTGVIVAAIGTGVMIAHPERTFIGKLLIVFGIIMIVPTIYFTFLGSKNQIQKTDIPTVACIGGDGSADLTNISVVGCGTGLKATGKGRITTHGTTDIHAHTGAEADDNGRIDFNGKTKIEENVP